MTLLNQYVVTDDYWAMNTHQQQSGLLVVDGTTSVLLVLMAGVKRTAAFHKIDLYLYWIYMRHKSESKKIS